MERVLIIGANGFLGRKLLPLFANKYDIFGADIDLRGIKDVYKPYKIDITNFDELYKTIKEINPNLTILTAAMTDVDGCEEKPELANKINAIGPQNLAKCIKLIRSRLIHISTDFIFDGVNGNYKETDQPHPLSVYGETKLNGEILVLKENIPTLICRTSVLFGWPDQDQKDNFFSWAYKQLKQGKKLKIVKNQINTPTFVDDLANFIYNFADFKKSDIYHTVCPETVTRYAFIEKLIQVFNFDKDLLEETTGLIQKAKRPENSSLNSLKIQKFNKKIFNNVIESFQFLKQTKPSFL